MGSSSSAFGDDVVLQLNGELLWQWWRSVERWRGGVESSTQWLLSAAVVMWWAGWDVGVAVVNLMARREGLVIALTS